MRRPYNTASSFVDLLFNVLMGFFMLLLIAIALVKLETSKKDKDVELRAEYVISVEWPNKSRDDVDLMVRTPQKEFVYYGRRDVKSASLDRDDLGDINDVIMLEDGTKIRIEENWEHITLRKALKGEYIVGVLMFNKRDKSPIEVKVKVEKLNPYRVIYSSTVTLGHINEEQTIVRFNVDEKGNGKPTSADFYSFLNNIPNGRPRR